MKTNYLFPSKFKKIAWFILIPTLVVGLPSVILEYSPEVLNVNVLAVFIDRISDDNNFIGVINNNIFNEILGILTIVSAIVVAFSKEPDEDELISNIRLESLVWATYLNYGILLLAFLLIYDLSFFWVMLFNMFTILIFFIIRFNWLVWKLRKSVSNEE